MNTEYSLERAKAAARAIMQSWTEVNTWPSENGWYQVGPNWKLHLFVDTGKRRAVLFELNEDGYIIDKSKTYLEIPCEVTHDQP